jgi:hypothetical protein
VGIATGNTEIQRMIWDHFKKLYSNKLKTLKEMGKYLDTYGLPKLRGYRMPNICIMSNETKAVIEILSKIEKSKTG